MFRNVFPVALQVHLQVGVLWSRDCMTLTFACSSSATGVDVLSVQRRIWLSRLHGTHERGAWCIVGGDAVWRVIHYSNCGRLLHSL